MEIRSRIGAVVNLKVEDYFQNGRRFVLRLSTKVSKEHDVPCHHRLDQRLHDDIEAAGIADDIDGYLFRSARRKTGQLTIWRFVPAWVCRMSVA